MRTNIAIVAICAAGAIAAAGSLQSRLTAVDGVVSVGRNTRSPRNNGEVAIWLTPEAESGQPGGTHPLPRGRLRIVQQNKHFAPHMLVVPVGSVVDFPNADPFFHNVFSLFDGKRFDLGLYESGTSRSVPFNRMGVCYIFCNIHPEMSAVVVVVDTSYYAVSNEAGEFTIANVPWGRYVLSVWHESHKPEQSNEFPRTVNISQARSSLGVIRLIESEGLIVGHKNKYGRDYTVPPAPSPVYK